MREQFHGLTFEQLPCGTVRMEQQDATGARTTIDAHPAQLIHVARILAGSRASPDAERIKTLERRLRWLYDRFLSCYEALPSDFYDNCRGSLEFGEWLDASCTVAQEYCADLTAHPVEATPIRNSLGALRTRADELLQFLDSVPCMPPGSGPTEDVQLAQELLGAIDKLIADMAP